MPSTVARLISNFRNRIATVSTVFTAYEQLLLELQHLHLAYLVRTPKWRIIASALLLVTT